MIEAIGEYIRFWRTIGVVYLDQTQRRVRHPTGAVDDARLTQDAALAAEPARLAQVLGDVQRRQ
jgi:hypothetical protein